MRRALLIARLVFVALFVVDLIPAWAQVNFMGSGSVNFASQPVGSPSGTQALSFSIASGTVVGSIAVVTTGLANLDFVTGAATTCITQTSSSTATCIVQVTFTPQAAGLRAGAVVFYSGQNNGGTVLASVPLYGVGTGPQVALGPGIQSALAARVDGTELENPSALAINAEGDLFILDTDMSPDTYRLLKVPADGTPVTILNASVNGAGLYLPSCIAIDGAGNLYVGEFYGRIVEVPANGAPATAGSPLVNGVALNYPAGLALDGPGDLFVGDFMNNRVLQLPAGGGVATAIDPLVNGIALNDPHGLVVDPGGDLFIADLANDRVVEISAASGAASAIDPIVNGLGLQNPEDAALDGAGDLYIADNVNHRVVEVPAGGMPPIALDPMLYDDGQGAISAVAADHAGDLFLVEGGIEGGHSIIEEIQRSRPPAMQFKSLTNVGSTDFVDGEQTVQIVNVGNAPLMIANISFPADFSPGSADANACMVPMNVSPGQSCDLQIQFTPQTAGALNESVVLTDNALNREQAQQSISVSGNAQSEAELVTPLAGTVLPGPSVQFTWTAVSGITWYMLLVGSTGVGSSNLFNSGERNVTSWTATELPTNGEMVYVRIVSNFSGVRLYADYLFTAATQASLVSPAAGSVLTGSSATFTWTAGTNATSYILWLGTTGAGSKDLYASGAETGTSVTVTGLPTNGATIYARLYTSFNGVLVNTDSTYTAATKLNLTISVPRRW